MIFSARSDPAAKCDARVGKDVEDVRNQDTGERQEAGEGKKPHHQRQVAAVQRTHGQRPYAESGPLWSFHQMPSTVS